MVKSNEVKIVREYGKDGSIYIVQLGGTTLQEFSSQDYPTSARRQAEAFARELRERDKPAAVIEPDAIPEFADWLHQGKS